MNDISAAKEVTPKGDVFTVKGTLTDGSISFVFEDVVAARGDIEAIVTARFKHKEETPIEITQRLSAFSNTSRESFSRLLDKCFGHGLKWHLIVSYAVTAFRKKYRQTASDGIVKAPDIVSERPSFLLEPYLEAGSANLLFSKGGIGKTFFALRLAMSVVTGEPLFGFKPSKPCRILFLDWENSDKTYKDRLIEVAKHIPGGMEALEKCYYKDTKGLPLTEMAESLTEFVKENEIGLLIIDSAAPACGGAPEEAVTATRFFAALRQIGVTSLTIAHESKVDKGDYAFGSVFFTNLARNIFNLKSLDDQQGTTRHLLLTHKKFNNGPLQKPLTFIMHMGSLGVEFAVVATVAKRSAAEKVVSCLRENGDMGATEIGELELISRSAVNKALAELVGSGAVMSAGKGTKKWRLTPR